jgi:hypothetical protein
MNCNCLYFKLLREIFFKKKYKFTLFSALIKGKNLKFGFFDFNCDEVFFLQGYPLKHLNLLGLGKVFS